jgi:tripartite-type tricarboxylate transporter receptor subunit TctC
MISRFMRYRRMSYALIVVTALGAQMNGGGAAHAADRAGGRPVRFIVPFAAGGGTDIVARVYAATITKQTGQNYVVDNRPGASGAVGLDITANAIPDGNTICIISASNAVNSAVNTKLTYDLARDLQGITQVTSAFFVLVVHQSFPARSTKELIAYAKARPGKLNYGSSGTGGVTHLAGALFAHMAGIEMVHIPYRGESAALTELLGGQTQLQFASPLNVAPHVAAGTLRALAISAAKRSPAMPDVPTIAESGVPGYDVSQWYGVVTSAKAPMETVNRFSQTYAQAARDPELARRLKGDGVEAVTSTPAAFQAHVVAEVLKWKKLVKEAGLQLQ